MVLSSGKLPWKLVDLKAKLSKLWMILADCRLMSLGKSYFQIILKSPEDKNKVWSLGSINPGVFHLQPWVPDFNPSLQKSTNTRVWVRFYDLSWEY